MRVTAIIGTAQKGGTVSRICEKILQGAAESGHETELIYLSDYTIHHCSGCWSCKGDKNCKIQDDFHQIYQKCVASDIIILGSPIYFGNITGLMKDFFDRHNGNACFNPPLMGELRTMSKKERLKAYFGQVVKEYKVKPEIQGKRIIRVVTANKPLFLLRLTGELRTTLDALGRYIKDMQGKHMGTIVYAGTQMAPEKEAAILKKAYKLGDRLSKLVS